MITIKNICTTFSTLENGCRVLFFSSFFFFCCYENKPRNRGAVLRGDEVEKELHNGGSKRGAGGDVSEETSLYSSVLRAYAWQNTIFLSSLVRLFVVHTGAA